MIDNNSIDIIDITETWGTPDIFDCEMEIPGFKLYRKDRSVVNDKKGGGVALYIKNSLNSVECDLLNAESCESFGVELLLINLILLLWEFVTVVQMLMVMK